MPEGGEEGEIKKKNSRPGVTIDWATSFTRVLIPHLLQWPPVRTHFKVHPASASLQGARATTDKHTHAPRYTVRTQPAGPRALPPENTRACTPPGDVNKPRTHGAGRGSRDCSHRVTYVHAPPPPPPPPWLPPRPAHRLPASPSGAPRWAEVQGAPTGRSQARPGALTPSAVPVPDAVLPALRQARRSARAGRSCPRSCRGGGPRPLSSPTPLRSGPRFTRGTRLRAAPLPSFVMGRAGGAGGRSRAQL